MKFAVEGSVIFSSVCAENLVQKFEELRPLRRRNIRRSFWINRLHSEYGPNKYPKSDTRVQIAKVSSTL